MRVEGNKLRLLVEDRMAVYPILVDPIAQQAYLKASNTDANDRFGYSVAISPVTRWWWLVGRMARPAVGLSRCPQPENTRLSGGASSGWPTE